MITCMTNTCQTARTGDRFQPPRPEGTAKLAPNHRTGLLRAFDDDSGHTAISLGIELYSPAEMSTSPAGGEGMGATVAAGTSVGTLLRPQGERELSMSYTRAGQIFHWRGPVLEPGHGYAIHLHVASRWRWNAATRQRRSPSSCALSLSRL
jgi:hypothetical protein